MRILFCNNSFPGQFESLAESLAETGRHKIVFLSCFMKKDFFIPGITSLALRPARGKSDSDAGILYGECVRLIDSGHNAYQAFLRIRKAGFIPDMIFTSPSGGMGLFLRIVFPEAFIVSYFEDIRRIADSAEERERKSVDLYFRACQMVHGNMHFVAAEWQKKVLPQFLRQNAKITPYFADTEYFVPAEKPREEIVSFNLKSADLSIRKTFIPIAAGLLAGRPACRAVLCLGSQTLRRLVEEDMEAFPEEIRRRMEIAEFLPKEEYLRVLQQSSLHVCPDGCEPPMKEMLECLSCETLLMAPERISKFVIPLPKKDILEGISSVLDNLESYAAMRSNGRKAVVRYRDKKRIMNAHIDFLMKEYSRFRGIK